jgi:hypothetical protein
MSGVGRSARSEVRIERIVAGKDLGLVDPTVEIMQPGGPYDYGFALLTDGAGSYTLAPTLRPYFLTFRLPRGVGVDESVSLHHHGVDTGRCGVPIPTTVNLIAISVAVDVKIRVGSAYVVEVFERKGDELKVIGTLEFATKDKRSALRRDLSEQINAGGELGVRIVHAKGRRAATFQEGLVTLELEG